MNGLYIVRHITICISKRSSIDHLASCRWQISDQNYCKRMNWTTKAKTRAGRGKSKADIENQLRLTARNKLPRRKSTSEAVRFVTSNGIIPPASQFKPFSDRSSELSNDLMMLQNTSSSVALSKLRPNRSEQQHNRRTPKAVHIDDTEDPLLLLELTVICHGKCSRFIKYIIVVLGSNDHS